MVSAVPQKSQHDRPDRYRVSVEEYRNFRRNGFLVCRNVVAPHEIDELRQHTEDLMQGKLPEQNALGPDGKPIIEAPPESLSPDEKAEYFLRIHMLHRQVALHERYLLHPRVLDVVAALIGPDVMAMQTMLFLKPPGKPGQGWHQDTFYIPTHPDSLLGAWIAIDACDEFNGAMWFAQGSQVEPVYPTQGGYGYGDRQISDISTVAGVSDIDDSKNDLSKVADRYPQVLVCANPGDLVLFGGHVLHRSKQNVSTDRYRRSFVSHYANARSFTQWGADNAPGDPHGAFAQDPITKMTNASHILARGDSHLPFAQPKFGTSCAATLSPAERQCESQFASSMMGDMDSGLMGAAEADPNQVDNDEPAPTMRA